MSIEIMSVSDHQNNLNSNITDSKSNQNLLYATQLFSSMASKDCEGKSHRSLRFRKDAQSTFKSSTDNHATLSGNTFATATKRLSQIGKPTETVDSADSEGKVQESVTRNSLTRKDLTKKIKRVVKKQTQKKSDPLIPVNDGPSNNSNVPEPQAVADSTAAQPRDSSVSTNSLTFSKRFLQSLKQAPVHSPLYKDPKNSFGDSLSAQMSPMSPLSGSLLNSRDHKTMPRGCLAPQITDDMSGKSLDSLLTISRGASAKIGLMSSSSACSSPTTATDNNFEYLRGLSPVNSFSLKGKAKPTRVDLDDIELPHTPISNGFDPPRSGKTSQSASLMDLINEEMNSVGSRFGNHAPYSSGVTTYYNNEVAESSRTVRRSPFSSRLMKPIDEDTEDLSDLLLSPQESKSLRTFRASKRNAKARKYSLSSPTAGSKNYTMISGVIEDADDSGYSASIESGAFEDDSTDFSWGIAESKRILPELNNASSYFNNDTKFRKSDAKVESFLDVLILLIPAFTFMLLFGLYGFAAYRGLTRVNF
ncbi:hypothetical protein V1511DRAFT_297312 [Dipodascopsis uninucleata]